MEYDKRVLLDWILYNNKFTYSYDALEEIKRFVDKYYEDALLACGYLYSQKENSTKIFLAIEEGKLKEFIFGISKEIINSNNNSVTGLFEKINYYKEIFLTENVNRFRKEYEEGCEESYLENLLIDWFSMANICPFESLEYSNFLKMVKKYNNEIIDTLFISALGNNKIYNHFLKTLLKGDFEDFADYVRVTVRNFEITYKDKYPVLRNKFILTFEETVVKSLGEERRIIKR